MGYPEKATTPTGAEQLYNALVFVSATGDVLAHYRKTFLYSTDETWASEGHGFLATEIQMGERSHVSHTHNVNGLGGVKTSTKVTAGICMDINPYKFTAPWTAYEFANHVLASKCPLVVLSMAWLTRMSAEDLAIAQAPDMDTFSYWMERMSPLVGPNGPENEMIVVFANRAGEEGTDPRLGPVRYAGTSAIVGMRKGDGEQQGEVRIWEVLGRGEEGVCVADTSEEAPYRVGRGERTSEG